MLLLADLDLLTSLETINRCGPSCAANCCFFFSDTFAIFIIGFALTGYAQNNLY